MKKYILNSKILFGISVFIFTVLSVFHLWIVFGSEKVFYSSDKQAFYTYSEITQSKDKKICAKTGKKTSYFLCTLKDNKVVNKEPVSMPPITVLHSNEASGLWYKDPLSKTLFYNPWLIVVTVFLNMVSGLAAIAYSKSDNQFVTVLFSFALMFFYLIFTVWFFPVYQKSEGIIFNNKKYDTYYTDTYVAGYSLFYIVDKKGKILFTDNPKKVCLIEN